MLFLGPKIKKLTFHFSWGFHMDFLRFSRDFLGFALGLPVVFLGFSRVFPGFSRGFPMVFPGFSRSFSGVSRGFPGVFPEFSGVFLGVFPGYSRQEKSRNLTIFFFKDKSCNFSKIVSVLLSASVERFFVSRTWAFSSDLSV